MEKEVEKISLSKCRSVLEKDGSKYSDAEVLEIRDFLYRMAALDYQVYLKEKLREMEFEKEKLNKEDNNFKQAA